MSRRCDGRSWELGDGSRVLAADSQLLARNQFHLRLPRSDLRTGRSHKDVDLAPHPEVSSQIDPRLYGKAYALDQGAIIVSLVIVKMRPGAVEIAIDGMAGSVHEGLPVSRRLDHAP